MKTKDLRQLLYSSGAIMVLGVALSLFALEEINTASARADEALSESTLATVDRANVDVSRSTLILALAATMTPVLLFLNVLGFVGLMAPAEPSRLLRKSDPPDDPAQLSLVP